MIIDPGDEADRITSVLEEANLTPSYILLSHGHFDHIGAVPRLSQVFPKAQIAIHSLDSQYLGSGAYETQSLSAKAALGSTGIIDASWKDMPAADCLFKDGDKISCTGFDLTVLHLPGHTPGSAAFFDEEAGIIFTGDTLFYRSYGRTDLPGGSEDQIYDSLERLFSMEPDIIVYPGHGRTTTIGKERDLLA